MVDLVEWEKGHDDESSFAHRVEADGRENELAMVLLLSITNLKGIQSFRYVTYVIRHVLSILVR